jgi:hypothetical protein
MFSIAADTEKTYAYHANEAVHFIIRSFKNKRQTLHVPNLAETMSLW